MKGAQARREDRRLRLRGDWEGVKDRIMEEVVRAKFAQNPELLEMLIATGCRELVEGNRWHDSYWGVDLRTGIGDNHLGLILMKVREELGGEEYRKAAAAMREAAENEARLAREAAKKEIAGIETRLAALPRRDFSGASFRTKAFGRVTITRQEGEKIFFMARGAERKFALPDCVVQGFLLPDDLALVEEYRLRWKMGEQLKELRRKVS